MLVQVSHAVGTVSVLVGVSNGLYREDGIGSGLSILISLDTASISEASSDVLLLSGLGRQAYVVVRVSILTNSCIRALGDTLGRLIGRRSGAPCGIRLLIHQLGGICRGLGSWTRHYTTVHGGSHFLSLSISQTWHLQGHV